MSELSNCPACSLQLAVVQLTVVGLYNKCCRDPRVKSNAERNAERREAHKQWQADEDWEACKNRFEEQLKREKRDRDYQRTMTSVDKCGKTLKKNRAV